MSTLTENILKSNYSEYNTAQLIVYCIKLKNIKLNKIGQNRLEIVQSIIISRGVLVP